MKGEKHRRVLTALAAVFCFSFAMCSTQAEDCRAQSWHEDEVAFGIGERRIGGDGERHDAPIDAV